MIFISYKVFMKNIDCNVIKDLLPSYIDKISSDETNKLVEEHLSKCKNCISTLNNMSKDVTSNIQDKQKNQIDYLKKYHKNKIMTVVFAILLTICIIWFASLTYQLVSSYVKLPIDLNELDLSHMAIDSDYPGLYFYSKKYIIVLDYEYFLDENGNKIIYIDLYGKIDFSPGGTTFSIHKEDTSKVYLRDGKGNVKEVWDKNVGFLLNN